MRNREKIILNFECKYILFFKEYLLKQPYYKITTTKSSFSTIENINAYVCLISLSEVCKKAICWNVGGL